MTQINKINIKYTLLREKKFKQLLDAEAEEMSNVCITPIPKYEGKKALKWSEAFKRGFAGTIDEFKLIDHNPRKFKWYQL